MLEQRKGGQLYSGDWKDLDHGTGEVWPESGHRSRDMSGAGGWHGVERVCLGWAFRGEEEWEMMLTG